MKKFSSVVFLLLVSNSLFAFEPSMLNLKVPSLLEGKSLLVVVQHRFRGILTEDPLEHFFGLDLGATVSFGLRYAVVPRLELNAAYTTLDGEYRVGASYAHHMPMFFLKAQAEVEYFSFERFDERFGNFFCNVVLQSYPIWKILSPVINLGYDGYNEKFGLGVGLQAGFDWWFGPIERINVIGEYFPVIQSEEGITGQENYFATGLRIDTYGHRFMLQVGNGWNIGPRRLMLGTVTNDLYFGFNVYRLLKF